MLYERCSCELSNIESSTLIKPLLFNVTDLKSDLQLNKRPNSAIYDTGSDLEITSKEVANKLKDGTHSISSEHNWLNRDDQ